MKSIQIKDGNKIINLHTENNIVKLDVIKTYFPNAKSLTYCIGEDTFGLNSTNGNIELPSEITLFNVFNYTPAKGMFMFNESIS